MDDDSLGDSSGAVCVQVELIAEKGDLEGGIQQFRKAIELNPWITRAHLNLGVALAKPGHLEAATRQFERAITLKPEYADAHVALSTVACGTEQDK